MFRYRRKLMNQPAVVIDLDAVRRRRREEAAQRPPAPWVQRPPFPMPQLWVQSPIWVYWVPTWGIR
jgi:hypothetical protein